MSAAPRGARPVVLAVQDVVAGERLTTAAMEAAMEAVLAGEATEIELAALAIALRMRGETAEEIAAAARVMRERCTPVTLDGVTREGEGTAAQPGVLLDTCGTGGDGAGTFNVSTVAAIVVAACGVRVAKHGNRAVSSRSGSADVLEALGVRIDLEPARVARCIREVGIGFLFAPAHHGALRHAAPVRRALGVRTFFNLLGPLCNPAGATHQLVGVYDGARVRQMAEVLGRLGVEGAWVVHGEGGLDEVSPCGPTHVAALEDGEVTTRVVEPADFGLKVASTDALAGGDSEANALIAREVLAGGGGERRAAVVINAAAALVVAGEGDLRVAAERAEAALDSGAASRLLERWIAATVEG